MWFRVPLCMPNTSWKFVGLIVKHSGVMSFKCRRNVASALCQKMRTQKLYNILKNIITKGMTYTQNTTKQISLFNAYERLKSPPLGHSSNFTSNPIPMFSILGLKFKLKSKLQNKFNLPVINFWNKYCYYQKSLKKKKRKFCT